MIEVTNIETPAPDVPWPVPESVTPAQIRLALLAQGQLETVQSIADSDPSASIVWEYAITIDRASPLISALGAAIYTEEQIDELFREAAKL